ncbi:Serpentine type 7TM GPCR receptor class ab chemoreceptor family protein [Brugia pahangi]
MELCKQASELANSIVFNAILILVIIISVTGIIFEIWVMLKTTNHILLHRNIRILIITHQLWLILHCAARIFAHLYVLVSYQKTYTDPCGYMAYPWECFMMRTPITLTLLLNAASIPTVVIERAIATYFSARYEKSGISVAIILFIAQLTIGFGSFFFIVSNFNLFDSKKVVYCSTSNEANALKSAIRLHRNKIHVNLSHRYQIMENINSLQTLSPMVAFYSIFLAIFLGALFMYFAIDFKFSPKQFAIYLESVQLTPLYALTLPIAIVWTEKYVRKTVQENRRKVMELTGSKAADHYFTIFERSVGKNG